MYIVLGLDIIPMPMKAGFFLDLFLCIFAESACKEDKPMIMRIYDFDNEAHDIDIGDKPIAYLVVTILSGDETVGIKFSDGTTAAFDPSSSRIINHYDGMYLLDKKEDIKRWLNWRPTDYRKYDYFSYCRQDDFKN